MLAATMRTGDTQAARRSAVQDLASYPGVESELAEALRNENDFVVQAAILAALVSIGTKAAAAAIAEAVCTQDAALRNAATEALGGFGTKALPQIECLLASPHPEQRIVAVGLLEACGDIEARTMLHKVLASDPDVNVGLGAVEALSLLGDPADEAALRGFALRFAGNAFVAFAVQLACQRSAAGAAT